MASGEWRVASGEWRVQNADGSFAAGPGQPSTLGATNTGLRVLDGLIAVQIHAGGPMEVQFKDIQLRVLP